MGQHASRPPDPSQEIQVIGAGMSRTLSFTIVLKRLLDGPVYHGGEAIAVRDERQIKTWIDILRHAPCKSDADRAFMKEGLREQLRGYVALTDAPACGFVEELIDLFPDAKVVATIRDPDDWWRSMEPVVRNSKMGFFGHALLLVADARVLHGVCEGGGGGAVWRVVF